MKKNKPLFYLGIFFMSFLVSCNNQNKLTELLSTGDENFKHVLNEHDKYELQIIYTRIDHDKDGGVNFSSESFNEQPNKYFYPASTVKFPAAVLALEKLNDLNIPSINKYTHLSIDSVYAGHVHFDKDFKNECGYPNIADYIKRIFVVSDNEAFNRLYDFLGQNEINDRLKKRGFKNTKITHRLSVARTPEQNIQSNPIKFYNSEGSLVYEQHARNESTDIELLLTGTEKGKGYFSEGNLINQPKDFSQNNFFGLRDQHELLKRIFFPDQFEESERFNLTKDDYTFLKECMSMLPRQSECPKYESDEYYDGYVKFLMFGDTKESIPDNIKIYNKSGLAYGYLTDNCYIVDEKNGVEFLLSATLHVNENQIYNDDNYEYDEIGIPFLAELGRMVYEYEKSRR